MNDAEAMALDFATLVRLGGPVAVILIALSVVALAMSLYKIIQFAIIRVGRHKPALFAMDKWFDGERDDAYEHIMNHRAPLSRVMAHAMRGVTHSGIHLDTVKEDTTRVALEELRTLRKYLRGLELISQTAPLLGLFGTVVGMIQAFSQLQASGAAVNPAGGYGFVSSLVFHPTNKNLAYATFSTFGIPHVWKSIDAGATWTNIDGSGATALPDIPVHSIVIDPADTNRLYVGTDLGVFVSLDDGANWAVENTGFANVITESLSLINTGAAYKLFAFTHGRGVFRVTVHGQDPTPTPTPTPTSTPDPNCTTKPAKPTLLKPKNNGSIKKLAVPLDWNDETCTTNFVVVVKQDSKKGTKVDGKTIAVSQYTTKQLAKGKTYFWQVKACNGIGCTKSDWWSFKVK